MLGSKKPTAKKPSPASKVTRKKPGGVKVSVVARQTRTMRRPANAYTTRTRRADALDALVAARRESIRQAHASNLIEGADMGAEVLAALLERAGARITDEEFARREMALIKERYSTNVV